MPLQWRGCLACPEQPHRTLECFVSVQPDARGSYSTRSTTCSYLNAHPVSRRPVLSRARQGCHLGFEFKEQVIPLQPASGCPFTQRQNYLFLALPLGLLDLTATLTQQHIRHPCILAQAAQASDQGPCSHAVQPSSSAELPGPAKYSVAASYMQILASRVQEEDRLPSLVTGVSNLKLSLSEAQQLAISSEHKPALTSLPVAFPLSSQAYFAFHPCSSWQHKEDRRLTTQLSPLGTALEMQQRLLEPSVSPLHVAECQSWMNFSCWWNNLIALQRNAFVIFLGLFLLSFENQVCLFLNTRTVISLPLLV